MVSTERKPAGEATPDGLPGMVSASQRDDREYNPASIDPQVANAPSSTELRPYQRDVIDGLRTEISGGCRRPLLVMVTGGGKTVVASAIVGATVTKGNRCLFLAHRRELIQQASDKLYRYGIDHGVVQAGFPTRPDAPVQVASIQTLWARAMRSRKMELPPADLVVVDEAHRCRSRTYRQIIDSYADSVVLGLTATPCRSDGRGLGNVFDRIVEGPTIRDLIGLGFLVPTRVYAPTEPDLTGVRVERGDYVEKQLAERMDRPQLVGDVVSHWHRLNPERRATVVFATGVEHSVHLRDEFRRSDVCAEHIDGATPADERDEILARLSRGEVEVVTNCMVLTEGWDQPEVSCCVLARPTKHMGLYRQMVGRVLRPAPGKDYALVLDHAGAVFQHGFVEEPVTWRLAEDKRAESASHSARLSLSVPSLTTCPECSAVRMSGKPCTFCGWKPAPRPDAVEVTDGELGRVDQKRHAQAREYTPAERALFHRQLLWIAHEKGYKPGWAAHKYREKFGDWPADRHTFAEPPDDAVRSWVRSRQIAYAKARAKQRGAA